MSRKKKNPYVVPMTEYQKERGKSSSYVISMSEYQEQRRKQAEEKQQKQQQRQQQLEKQRQEWTKKQQSWQNQRTAGIDDTYQNYKDKLLQFDANRRQAGSGNPYAIYGKGNIDLSGGPQAGTFRKNIYGKEVLLPSMVGGKQVSEDEAEQNYLKTGENLGIFDTQDEADAYAKQLQNLQALYQSGSGDQQHPFVNWAQNQLLKDPGYRTDTGIKWKLDKNGKWVEAKTTNKRTLTRPFSEQSMLEQMADPNSRAAKAYGTATKKMQDRNAGEVSDFILNLEAAKQKKDREEEAWEKLQQLEGKKKTNADLILKPGTIKTFRQPQIPEGQPKNQTQPKGQEGKAAEEKGNPYEFYGKGNIGLSTRPQAKNEDGSYSTVDSFSVNIDGKEVLLPSIIDGKRVRKEEAIRHYEETGENLGVFDTPEEADAYAQQLHELQEQYYAGDEAHRHPYVNWAQNQLLQDPGYQMDTVNRTVMDKDISGLSKDAQTFVQMVRNEMKKESGIDEISAMLGQLQEDHLNFENPMAAMTEALPYIWELMDEYTLQTKNEYQARQLTRPFSEQSMLEQMADPNSRAAQAVLDVKAKSQADATERYKTMLKLMDAQDMMGAAYGNLGSWMGGPTEEVSKMMNVENAQPYIETVDQAIKQGMFNDTSDPATMTGEGRRQLKMKLENENLLLKKDIIPGIEKQKEKIEELEEGIKNVSQERLLTDPEYRTEFEEFLKNYEKDYGSELFIDEYGYLTDSEGNAAANIIGSLFDKLDNKIDWYESKIRTNNATLDQIDRYNGVEKAHEILMDPEGSKQRYEELDTKRFLMQQEYDLSTDPEKRAQLEDQLFDIQQELDLYEPFKGIFGDGDFGTDTGFHPEYDQAKDIAERQEENSKKRSDTKQKDISVHGIYSFINGGKEYQYWRSENQDWITNEYRGAMAMTGEEKEQFNRLYNDAIAEGREPVEAQAFLEGLQSSLNQRLAVFDELSVRQTARRLPVGSSAASLVMTAEAPFMAARTIGGKLLGEQEAEDPNSWLFSSTRAQNWIESQVAEDLGPEGGFVYNAGMSGLKNFVRGIMSMGFGPAAPAVNLMEFAGEAFMTSYQQELDKSGNADASFLYALTDAAISTLFEVVSVEKLYSDPTKYMDYLLQNMSAEMSEEFFEGVFSPYIHELFNGRNKWKERADEIQAAGGYTDGSGNWVEVGKENAKEAWRQACREWNSSLVESMASAGLSVGGPAAFGGVRLLTTDRDTGKAILNANVKRGMDSKTKSKIQTDNIYDLVKPSLGMKEGTETRSIAESIDEKIKNQKKVSNREIGKLAAAIVRESDEQIGGIAQDVMGEAFLKRLKVKGKLEQKEAAEITQALVRAVTTNQLNAEDAAAIFSNDEATKILQEFGDSEERRKFLQETEAARTVKKSLMDLVTGSERNNVTEDDVSSMMDGAIMATPEEIEEAEAAGGKTGSGTEVIANGRYGEITGFGTRIEKIKGEDGKVHKETIVTVTVGKGENAQTVDLNQVKATNEGTAQVLRFIDMDGGQTVTQTLGKTLLKLADGAKNLKGSVADAMSVMWSQWTGQTQARVTNLTAEQESEIRAAVQADMDAADQARLKGWREIKPGHGTTTYNGTSYGTKEFSDALKKDIKNEQVRREALTIASIAKSAGVDVTLYYDEENRTKQGVYFSGNGISINLAGTYDKEGTHRSALATFAHELTHNLEANSLEAYKQLRTYVMQNLKRFGYNLNTELNRIMANYKAHGEQISMSGAMAEITAMGCEQVLTDDKTVAEIKEQDPTLYGNMKKAIRRLVGLMNSVKGGAIATSSRYAKAMNGITSDIARMWKLAYNEAAGAEGTATAGGIAQASNMEDTEHRKQTIDVKDAIINPLKYKDYFTYDNLIKKEPIKLTKLNPINTEKSRKDIVNAGIKNAKENGKIIDGNIYVHVYDTGTDVKVIESGLRHGLNHKLINQPATEKIGEILKEAVLINTSRSRDSHEGGQYWLLGAGENSDGNGITYVILSVNRKTNTLENIDTLYSIRSTGVDVNNNIETAATKASVPAKKPTLTVPSVTIAKALDSVKDYLGEVLPVDVMDHFNKTRKVIKDTPYLQHSIQEQDEQNAEEIKEEISSITESKANDILKKNGEIAYAPAQYSFAGEGAEGVFGDDVREAYRMDKEGATDEEIRAKTNCIRGFNGRWWRVLDNNKMGLTVGANEINIGSLFNLEDIYDAKELYQAYPQLKNVKVSFYAFDDDAVAKASPMQISYNTDYLDRGNEGIEATLQHEIQHIIQEIENSNRGSSVTFWKNMQDMARARIANNDRQIQELYEKYGIDETRELAFGIEFNEDGTLDKEWLFPEELEKVSKMTENELDLYKALDKDNKKWVRLLQIGRTPTSLYRETVGEIEARAASEKTDENTRIHYPEGAITREEYTGEVTSRPGATRTNKPSESEGLEHLFGKANRVEQFSMQEPVEVNRDGLIAVHNLGADQLIKTLQLGGFPMPSIAIVKNDYAHNRYGDISVVFYPSTIDPKASKSNKVYGGDAWTPTYPSIEYKINSKELNKITKKLQSIVPESIWNSNGNSVYLYEENLENSLNRSRGDILSALSNMEVLKIAYMEDTGKKLEYSTRERDLDGFHRFKNDQVLRVLEVLGEDTVREAAEGGWQYFDEHPEVIEKIRQTLNEMFREKHKNVGLKIAQMDLYSADKFGANYAQMIVDAANKYLNEGIQTETDSAKMWEQLKDLNEDEEYKAWIRNQFENIIEKKGIRNSKDVFTNNGNRRSWDALHDEETLENVVRMMKAQADKGSNSFFSQSEMLALGTRDLKSIEDIRKHSGQLKHISDEEMSAAKTEIVNGFGQLMEELRNKKDSNQFIARDRALEAMVEAVKKTRTPEGIMRELKRYGDLDVPADAGVRIANLMQQIADLPTEYFEAKPQRAVGLNEIAKVIVPETASSELFSELDKRSIPYETYDGTDEGRLAALNRQEDAQFSFMDETDVDARAWMETVQESSLQTEAEKQLLRNFKSLRMRVSLKQEQERKYQGEIARLEAIPEGERTREQKSKLDGYRIRLENATKIKQQAEEELASITSSNGYVSLMYRQQRILNDFVYSRTQEEVRRAVERLEMSAKKIEERIRANREAAEALEKSGIVDRFRKVLGTTTADQTAAELKKAYNSTWTKGQIRTYLDPIITKMVAGEDFQQDVETLAGILVNSDSTNSYEELSGLRGLTITIGPGAMAELRAQNSSLKEVRARLAGTGITVKSGERSTLEADIADLRAEYPSMPDLGDEKDALGNFLNWIDGMKQASAANEFYEQRVAEAMAVITGKAAGAAKGIYMPNDTRAQKQVLAMMDFVKSLNAETAKAAADLQAIADELGAMRKAGAQARGMAITMAHDANAALDYFNRMAKIAEDTAKQKTRKDLIEQLKSDFTKKIAKNNEEWRNLIERDKNARKQMEVNRAYKNRINTVLKRAYNRLKNPKGLQNIPEYMQGLARELIGTFIDNDIDGGTRFTSMSRDALMETRRVLDAWEKESGKFDMAEMLEKAEEAVGLTINQDLMTIYDGITAINSEIKGKNKAEVLQKRGEILKGIQEAVSEIWSAIMTENTIQIRNRRIAVEDAAYKIATSMGNKQAKEWTGKAGSIMRTLHKAIVSGNMTPEYFFRTLGNAGLNDLWDGYHEAENRNGLELAKAKARMGEIADKYGYKNWDVGQKVTLELNSGAKVQMTIGQLMSLYATWKRETALGPAISEHLAVGGFYAEQDLRDGVIGKTAVEHRAHRIAVERDKDGNIVASPDMQRVEGLLTEEQKQFVDEMVGFMSSDMSELGNEASMKAYGIRLYKEGYYFPFQMWGGVKDRKSNDSGSAAAAQDRAFHPSFAKTRMHGANNALMIGDFMQTVSDHVAGMINYATMGLANENLQKALNFQLKEEYSEDETNKRNVWTMIKEAYGSEAEQYLLELQKQLNGGAVKTERTFYDKAISMFRKNAVAGSLSVAFQQPLSYIRAAMLINPKYLAQAATREYWTGAYKELMAHSGVAVIKDMGKFDMNAGQSAREYLMPDGMQSKGRKIYEGIAEYATILPVKMDAWTWTRMWIAVKLEQKALHSDMDIKSDEFLDLCADRFNEVMRRTQVYDSVLVRSENMRSTSPWTKSITSFMAEPTLTLNVLADAVRSAKQGEAGGKVLLAKAGATFMLSAVLQSLVKAIFSSGRTPDEKKTWLENLLYRFTGNIISEANPLSMVPGYNDLVTLLKDGKLEDDAMGAVGKIFTAGRGLADIIGGGGSGKGLYRDIEDSAGQLFQLFTNIPVKNIMREGRAMYNWFIEQPYAKRQSNMNVLKNQTEQAFLNADSLLSVILQNAGFSVSNSAYYQKIYDAKKAGNEEEAENLIDYLLTGGKVKDRKTIDSKVAAIAKKDEGASAEETADFLIAEGGNAEDYIRDQLREGKISAEDARKKLKAADPEKSDDDIWWTVDRIEYQMETGAEKTPTGNYYRFKSAVNNNSATEIQRAVKDLLAHGYTKEKIKSKLGDWKSEYLAADSNGKRKIRDALQKAFRAMGGSSADADTMIAKWEKDAKKKKSN